MFKYCVFLIKVVSLQEIKDEKMKFTILSSELRKKLSIAGSVLASSSSNSTNPILENFLFEVNQSKLTITASDGETTLVTSLEVNSEDVFKIAVPAKMLQTLMKTFVEQPLTFIVEANERGRGKKLDIWNDKDVFTIALDNEDEYPSLPNIDAGKTITIPSEVLYKTLLNTLFAVSNDPLRAVMTGVFFQFTEKGCNFASTDSHRLVVYTRKDIVYEDNVEFIIPKKALSVLKTILGNTNESVKIEFNENNARFILEDYGWVCRLIDGKYPNYVAVIPKDIPNHMTIGRNLLLSSIERASVMSSESTHQVRFKLSKDNLHLQAEDTEFGKGANMKVPCSYIGEPMDIGFDARYLSDILKALISDDVIFKMSQPNRPAVIEPIDGLEDGESILMLSMPLVGF